QWAAQATPTSTASHRVESVGWQILLEESARQQDLAAQVNIDDDTSGRIRLAMRTAFDSIGADELSESGNPLLISAFRASRSTATATAGADDIFEFLFDRFKAAIVGQSDAEILSEGANVRRDPSPAGQIERVGYGLCAGWIREHSSHEQRSDRDAGSSGA